MTILTASFVQKDDKKDRTYWNPIGTVLSSKTEDGCDVHDIPQYNTRLIQEADKLAVYNVQKNGALVKQSFRAFAHKKGPGFSIPTMNIVALVPKTN